ncbi:bifunctional phosphoribosyl-AMP cyclohydrolase/phosphoribosyl-ATP diphosphatase HisIE [Gammaproteobacteria bacterium]|nr:bifunctional phosphoribosyl-AMP cyclohydrolase/phosphoribosyl-ATP diphosphatase HisIE [Gammaproteobacteria bacterium]MDC1491602.1 bifunctional phosphoribosyl-AMP cyclohydrolase/phosphoribosyl-ATP diphosphatase HisIE [Gammaproteobacteria bacterium]|tara:strand:- start:565 stop:1158 length:594 start_codon:yes stop_codon:yes gene_type:complete
MNSPDWAKMNNLIPAIIQDISTREVLMLGYMTAEALEVTIKTKKVTFYSRSKNRLWTKGEESGNTLIYKEHYLDCDNDSFIFMVEPLGPTCHKDEISCFKTELGNSLNVLNQLEAIIVERFNSNKTDSYVKSLQIKGIKEIAKKLTEEAGETSIAAVTNDGRVISESADLMFHLLVLLKSMDLSINDITDELKTRMD